MKYDIGTEIGGYRLKKPCGAGAYGMVFIAENILTAKKFALKIIPMIGKSWERELNALIRYKDCVHQNLLQVHHIAQTDDAIYYVMDLADNLELDMDLYEPKTLSNRLQKETRISSEELIIIMNQLLNAVEFLHAHQLLHRDIKPDNILWISGRVVLGDIGLLSTLQNVSLVGTLGFMSEETVKGHRSATVSDDYYALGKVIYCALTGNSPKDFPNFPADMPLQANMNLISASIAACQAPYIQSASEFKKIMSGNFQPIKSSPKGSVWSRLLIGLIFMIVIGCVVAIVLLNNKNQSQTQPTPPSRDTSYIEQPQQQNISSLDKHSAANKNFGESVSSMRSDFARQRDNMLK